MRVAVFGATGKIGHQVVQQLLAAGHTTTAYVRTSSKVTLTHSHLTVLEGELSSGDGIAQALAGAQAVISSLGPTLTPGARGTPLTEGTKTIVKAMHDLGVRRFIGLATPSIADARDLPTLKAKLLPLMAGLAFPNALSELVGMTAAVTSSELDWTIARITNPNNGPAKGTLRSGFLGRDEVGWRMTRADIAAFMISQLFDDRYNRAAPAISN